MAVLSNCCRILRAIWVSCCMPNGRRIYWTSPCMHEGAWCCCSGIRCEASLLLEVWRAKGHVSAPRRALYPRRYAWRSFQRRGGKEPSFLLGYVYANSSMCGISHFSFGFGKFMKLKDICGAKIWLVRPLARVDRMATEHRFMNQQLCVASHFLPRIF